MTKVHVLEKFNTSFGEVLIVKDVTGLSIGDKILSNNGNAYTIKGFHAPTTPNKNTCFGIIV